MVGTCLLVDYPAKLDITQAQKSGSGFQVERVFLLYWSAMHIYDSLDADWIPEYLQEDTQHWLRYEMQKPPSEADTDKPGYLYIYQILSQ